MSILFIILICVIVSGFFSGMETGLFSADRLKIFSRRERGELSARAAEYMLRKPERLLGTTLIGTNISIVTASVILNAYLRDMGWAGSAWLANIALSLILLIFSEIFPKTLFRQYADSLSLLASPLLTVFHYLFLPVSWVLNGIVSFILLVTGQTKGHNKMPQSRDDFKLLIRLTCKEAGVNYTDGRFFDDIFDFRGTLAREVMIPYHRYPVCHRDQNIQEIVALSLKTNRRFIPVHGHRTDNMVGYVDVETLLSTETPSLKDRIQEAVFYPDTKRISDLLLEMNLKDLEVVFLSDEYGAISGIVTPSEIAGKIIGSIPGSGYTERRDIQVLGSGHYLVAGTTDLEEFYHETGIHIRPGHYETVGGFLMEKLGKIPAIDTVYKEEKITYRVVDRNTRHLTKIEVIGTPES